jgi:hypothetical protein
MTGSDGAGEHRQPGRACLWRTPCTRAAARHPSISFRPLHGWSVTHAGAEAEPHHPLRVRVIQRAEALERDQVGLREAHERLDLAIRERVVVSGLPTGLQESRAERRRWLNRIEAPSKRCAALPRRDRRPRARDPGAADPPLDRLAQPPHGRPRAMPGRQHSERCLLLHRHALLVPGLDADLAGDLPAADLTDRGP